MRQDAGNVKNESREHLANGGDVLVSFVARED